MTQAAISPSHPLTRVDIPAAHDVPGDSLVHSAWRIVRDRRQAVIAVIAIVGIALHLLLRFGWHSDPSIQRAPLVAVLALGGAPLVIELLVKMYRRQFGSDLLAGISI